MAKKLLVLVITVIVILSNLEMVVRMWDPNGSIRLYEDHQEVGRTYKPNLDVMVRADDGSRAELITNSFGFIGEEVAEVKEEETLRIVSHGDSFTSGHDADYDRKFVTLLAPKISEALGQNVESLNFGIPSQGTQESFLHYEHRARDFDPDIAILFFFLGNDFDENLEDLEDIQAKFAAREEGSSLRVLTRKSELVLYLLNRFVQISVTNEIMYRLGIIRERGDFSLQDENMGDGRADIPQRLRLLTTVDEPLNEQALSQARRYLTMFRDRTKEDSVAFVVVVLPSHAQAEQRIENAFVKRYPLLAELNFDVTRSHKALITILQDLNIDYIDMTPHFRANCEGNPACGIYICDDCHLGYPGHELVAEVTTDYLLEHTIPAINAHNSP